MKRVALIGVLMLAVVVSPVVAGEMKADGGYPTSATASTIQNAPVPATSPAPSPATAATVPKAARLKGKIVEKGTRAPVPGANITIEGTDLFAVSDDKGRFELAGIEPGERIVIAYAMDYAKAETKILKFDENQTMEQNFTLSREFYSLSEVVVQAEAKKKEVSQQTLTKEELTKIPGTMDDSLKAVQALPGVATASEFSGDMLVRGGGPGDNQILLDRTFTGYPFHFGGIVSTLSSDLIKTIDLYAGGFGPEYGNVMGAVLEVTSRDPRKDRIGGRVNVSMILSEVMAEGPISGNSGFFIAGRRSYLEALPFDWGEMSVVPRFYDYQGKIHYNPSENHEIDLLSYGSDDAAAVKKIRSRNTPEISGASIKYNSNFHTQGLNYSGKFGDRLRLRATFSTISNYFDFGMGQYGLGVRAFDAIGWEEAALTVADWNVVKLGVMHDTAWYKVKGFFVMPPKEGDTERFSFTDAKKVKTDISSSGHGEGYYLKDEITPVKSVSISLGARADYNSMIKKWAFSPRTSLNWDVVPDATVAKFAWGIYQQPPGADESIEDFGNPKLNMNRSFHYVFGVNQKFTKEIDADVQLYYKELDNLVVKSSKPGEIYSNEGVGFAYGGEFLIRHHLTSRFFGWLSYGYSHSKRRDHKYDKYRLFSYDQPHVINALASYQLTPEWSVSGKWRYSTGTLYTPIKDAIYDTDLDRWIPVSGELNSMRMPDYHRLDGRVERKYVFESWILTAYAEMQNVYLHENPLGVSYSADYKEQEMATFLPFLPYIGVTAEF